MGNLAPHVIVFIPQTRVFTMPLQSATVIKVEAVELPTLEPAVGNKDMDGHTVNAVIGHMLPINSYNVIHVHV